MLIFHPVLKLSRYMTGVCLNELLEAIQIFLAASGGCEIYIHVYAVHAQMNCHIHVQCIVPVYEYFNLGMNFSFQVSTSYILSQST